MGQVESRQLSVLAPGEQDSPFAVRRHRDFQNGPMRNPPEIQTMQDFQKLVVSKNRTKKYIGWRPKNGNTFEKYYIWKTYEETDKISHEIGSGLVQIGIRHKDFLGIYSDNSPEWIYTLDASCYYGFVIVSLYDSLGLNATAYIIEHSDLEAIFVSEKRLPNLIQCLNENKFKIRLVVLMDQDNFPENEKSELAQLGIESLTFNDVRQLGVKNPIQLPTVSPDDLHFICYSSGTTGNPKGVMISQRTNVSNILSVSYEFNLTEKSRYLSFLPLAHIYEKALHNICKKYATPYGLTSNGVRNLTEDMAVLKPTIFCMVPRVANRFYDNVQMKLKSSSLIKRGIFWGAFSLKEFCLSREIPTFPLDLFVFNAVKNTTGGCIDQFCCGGAYSNPEVGRFMQVVWGVPFRIGYGLTEAGSANVLHPDRFHDCSPFTVGGPLPNVEIKLDPIPEYHDPIAGELLVGGEGVCSGYFKDEEASKNLFVDENKYWVRTGDVGKYTPNGHVMIIDRLRSIFKLSQGEYVAVEYLTQAYSSADIVNQIFVYGDPTRSCIVAIIVPDRLLTAKYLGKEKLSDDEFKIACESQDFEKYVFDICTQTAKEKEILHFAYLRAIKLEPVEWTVENDFLTPTFKMKRKALQDKYQFVIEKLYESLENV